MTTAAIATMATVDAATIMAGIIRAFPCRPEATPFVALRLHPRPLTVLRIHPRALPLLGVQLSGGVGFLTAPLCLLALALTSPFVMGVAVGVGRAPAPAHVVADFPQLVQHHHRLAPQRNAREESHIGH